MGLISESTKEGIVRDIARHIGDFNDETQVHIDSGTAGERKTIVVRQMIGKDTIIVKLEVVEVAMV